MRAVELTRLAAAAEALRLRRLARRQALRAIFGAGAGLFGLATLVMLHAVAWLALSERLTPVQAGLVLLAVDAAIALGLGLCAGRNRPDAIEVEALQVRNQALAEVRASLTTAALATELVVLAMEAGRGHGEPRNLIGRFTRLLARLFDPPDRGR